MTEYVLRAIVAPKRRGPVAANAPQKLFAGAGYLAGQPPYGLVTKNNLPSAAEVLVFWRGRGVYDGIIVARTQAAGDGTWRVDGLDPGLRYDVVARIDGFNDLIVSDVTPAV